MPDQPTAEELTDTAERAWRWVLDQVRTDEVGPGSRSRSRAAPRTRGLPPYRDSMHNGIAGLAHVLAEIRLDRDWTDEESALGEAVGTRLRTRGPAELGYNFFGGLVSDIGAFVALGQEGAAAAVERLAALAEPDGWPQDITEPPRYLPDARVSDATLGTASVILGALWADRHGVAGARAVLEKAADVVLAEAEDLDGCLSWRFVPIRFRTLPRAEMPNWSHGQAGILAAVALAGHRLDRDDLVDAASRVVSTWCGSASSAVTVSPYRTSCSRRTTRRPATGTNTPGAGATARPVRRSGSPLSTGGRRGRRRSSPRGVWQRRCLEAVRHSGIPAAAHPGVLGQRRPVLWDRRGRLCLPGRLRAARRPDRLEFALLLAAALGEHAEGTADHTWWRFVEHRNAEPLLPPGVGWMQGAAGIAAFLFQAARAVRDGATAAPVARWTPGGPSGPAWA